MVQRRPTDGWLCRGCGGVFWPPVAPMAGGRCPWCYRSERLTPAASAKTRQRIADKGRRLRMLGERDGWDCWLCGKAIDLFDLHEHRASADRVLPGALGGTYDPPNVRLAHQSCNAYRAGSKVIPFAPFDRSNLADAVRVRVHRARFSQKGVLMS